MSKELRTALGIALKSDKLAGEVLARGTALVGDISLSFSQTASSRAATSAAWSKVIEITAKDADGNIHTWLNATYTSKVTAGDTSSAGTASVGSANITFVDGVAKVTLNGSAAAWLATETATLTVANLTILGFTVTGGTHVVTITA